MRFRAKFQGHQLAAAVVWLGVSCAWIHKPNADPAIRGAYLVSGVLWLLIGISCLANYFFTWLEIDAVGLIQRRLWSVRVVPWNEITRVGTWQPGARAAPMSDRGELVFQPAERDALVSALRAHASEADFDLLPVKP